MDFNPQHYFRAGTERLGQAQDLYKRGNSYALAMYTAGLAVECVLRAFRWQKDRSFEGRHNLLELFKASGLHQLNEARLQQQGVPFDEIMRLSGELKVAISELGVLWDNKLRFACEDRAAAFLRQIGRLERKKGNALKANSLDLLNAAQKIVHRGVALWESKKK
jgi:hypothetical protein